MTFYTVKEAISQGADYQLYEWQRHTEDSERWIKKQYDFIASKQGRIVIPVKQGIDITLFVDDLAARTRKTIYKSNTNYSHYVRE